MAWLYILLADIFEVAWPFILKWSAPYPDGHRCLSSSFVPSLRITCWRKRLNACRRQRSTQLLWVSGLRERRSSEWYFLARANIGRVCSLVLIVLGLIGLKFFSNAAG